MTKKGFTLIELLAVILILGIIALIAIPTVNNIINQSKKSAFETTSNNVVSAIEDACQLQLLKGETLTNAYTFASGVISPSLEIKGKLPTNGLATIDTSCNVTLNVNNGKFTATKVSSEDAINVVNGVITYTAYANGTALYFNPVTGVKCDAASAVSTTGTKTGCMKWYAFNDNGIYTSTVNLILDHNTSSLLSWGSTTSNINGPTRLLSQLQTDTSSWAGVSTRTDSYSLSNGIASYTINYNTYKARILTATDITKITGNTTFAETTSTTGFYMDSNNQTQTANTIGASNYDWLFDYTNGCTSYGCNVADSATSGYWIATAVPGSAYNAWLIYRTGNLAYNVVDRTDSFGLRPVITVTKAIFQ